MPAPGDGAPSDEVSAALQSGATDKVGIQGPKTVDA